MYCFNLYVFVLHMCMYIYGCFGFAATGTTSLEFSRLNVAFPGAHLLLPVRRVRVILFRN